MPSELIVPLAQIKNLRNHPDPETTGLQIAEVLGWQLVVGRDLYKEGEVIAYVPPDSVIPVELSDELGITKFLSNGRVRQVKLRGEPSFGCTVPVESLLKRNIDPSLPLGTNVAEGLGITKYDPPLRASAGDAVAEHALFQKYTNVSNLRNFPNILVEGEEVTASIKIHGTNCRVGLIEGQFMAGSHGLQRAEPEDYSRNTYWFPLSKPEVRQMLMDLTVSEKANQIILFGEVFGNIQKKYNYGVPNGIDFRAFDLLIDGRYLNPELFYDLCAKYGVQTAVRLPEPITYSYENIKNIAENIEKDPLGDHPIEGLIIKPVVERTDPRIGRVVLKYLTDTYLFDKKKTDYKDV
jgi:RNA ligase (TIGR02306 family)